MPDLPFELIPPDIRVHLMRNMDITQLLSWRAVGTVENHQVKFELLRRVRTLLRPITADVDEFRVMLRETGTVISGSVALRILDTDAMWQPNDYDLYVRYSQWERVLRYICALEGHVLESVVHGTGEETYEIPYPWLNQGIQQMARIRGPRANIDLMRSRNESAYYPICFFWSTIVMNAITADTIICAYPTHVQQRRAFCSPTIEGTQHAAKVKYQQRGYSFYEGGQSSCRRWSCPMRQRYFFDRGCCYIVFDSVRMDFPEPVSVSWQLSDSRCGDSCEARTKGPVVFAGSVEEMMATFDTVM